MQVNSASLLPLWTLFIDQSWAACVLRQLLRQRCTASGIHSQLGGEICTLAYSLAAVNWKKKGCFSISCYTINFLCVFGAGGWGSVHTVFMLSSKDLFFQWSKKAIYLTFWSLLVTWYTNRFNIQQLYALPMLYLCVLYLSKNKQRLVPLTA